MTRPIDADKLIAALKRRRAKYIRDGLDWYEDAFDQAIAIVERLAKAKESK